MLPAFKKKFSNIFWTTSFLVSLLITLFLLYKVRLLYLDYLKFHRLQDYRLETDDLDFKFSEMRKKVSEVKTQFGKIAAVLARELKAKE